MADKRTIKADICIIGAGSAGLSTAYAAANLGLTTVLYEGAAMGGDCLNHGCVPSKALLAAAKAANDMRGTEKYGVTIDAEPKVDWQKVRDHVQGVIDHIAPVDSVERFEGFDRDWVNCVHTPYSGPRRCALSHQSLCFHNTRLP